MESSLKKVGLWSLGVFSVGLIGLFAWYTISPFFISVRVDEELPGVPSGVSNVGEKKGGALSPSIVEISSGTIVGTAGHPASGTVRVVEVDGARYVRYEDYKTFNGPDLFVYLAKDLAAQEFINLGELKATEGNVNYVVPEGVDVSAYKYVLIWCRMFGVLFNSVELVAMDGSL